MTAPITLNIKNLESFSGGGKTYSGLSQRPNFSSIRHDTFTLDVEDGRISSGGHHFIPLRPQFASGSLSSQWELRCRAVSGELAGGCALFLPSRNEDPPSPRQVPHPVLGEWIRALHYTGLNWVECGSIVVAPGFSEEAVVAALWAAWSILMKRNDVSFLVGTAPDASLPLDMALMKGCRILEPCAVGPLRYFLYVE